MKIFPILFLVSAASLAAQVTVLSHATVIDGSGKAATRDTSIVISGERIQEIGSSSRIKLPSGAQVVDLTGRTVMPGIINLHGHVNANAAGKLRTYAAYGVTQYNEPRRRHG